MKNLSSVLTEQVSIRICGLCSYESTGLSMLLFSNSVMPNSLQPHGLAHQASLSFTISWSLLKLMSIDLVMPSNHLVLWCPLLLLLSMFPSIRVFSKVSIFTWGGQTIGVSALASVLPKNTQDWSPLEWTGWISLKSKGLLRIFNITVQKHQFFGVQLSSQSNSHIHTWPLEKP